MKFLLADARGAGKSSAADPVIKRVAGALQVSTRDELLAALDIRPETLRTWRKRGEVPLRVLANVADRTHQSIGSLTQAPGMKPRLKLLNSGRLQVLSPGRSDVVESQLKRLLTDRYGSMTGFAQRYGFKYSDVVTALSIDTDESFGTAGGLISSAGGVAQVRQVLGLRSEPSKAAIAQVAAQIRRRQPQRPATEAAA